MSVSKENLKAELLEIIETIGDHKDDCLEFEMKSFLKRWNAKQKGQFKDYGHGKMSDFLRNEVGVQELDGKHWIRITFSDASHVMEKGACAKSHPSSNCNDDSISNATASGNGFARPNSGEEYCSRTAELQILQLQVLNIIRNFLENPEKRQRKKFLTLNEINLAWIHKNPNTKFKTKGFGSLKSFLVNKLNFKPLKNDEKSDCFKITLHDVEKELRGFQDRETNTSVDDAHTCRGRENEDDKEPAEAAAKKDELLPAAIQSTICSDSNTDKGYKSSNRSSQTCNQPRPKARLDCSPESTITDKRISNKGYSEEERNFIQLATLLYKCGLEALRKLFLQIHPTWKNKPEDINRFKRGQLRIDNYEQSKFLSGDVNKWDITLICKVLLYTTVSKQKLHKEDFKGYKEAIKCIRDRKNSMLSHNNNNSIANDDYKTAIKDLRSSVIKISFDERVFDATLTGAEISIENSCYRMFLDELRSIREEQRESKNEILENQGDIKKDVSDIKQDISKILKKVESNSFDQIEVKQKLKTKPGWEEWIKVKRKLRHFDVENNQYILIVGRFEEVNSEHVKALANVPWKLVIDLDPNSDIDGFLSKFNPSQTKGGVVVTFTPSRLKDLNVDIIDAKRIPWHFANGRNRKTEHENDDQDDNEDKPKEDIQSWMWSFRIPLQVLLFACSQKRDKMKPMHCIVFGIKRDISIEIAEQVLLAIHGTFNEKNNSISYLSFAPKLNLKAVPNATFTNLSQNLFLEGLTSLFGISEEKYKLPSGQKDIATKLTQMQYNFLSEYLEILYIGCEEIPKELAEKEIDAFETEHLRKFLCGKAISFPSLHYRHDAARCLTRKVCDRTTEMLQHIHKPRIVQITHAPGSGGTTIARRVLWDLHEMHPCAIVKLDHAPENFAQDSEGEKYLNNICERILQLEERCEKTPAILVDGNSRQVRILSDCIVRKLEGRALILRCGNYEKPSDKEDEFHSNQAEKGFFHGEDEYIVSGRNDTYFSKEDEFKVKPRLKDDDNDYREFLRKYDSHCQKFPRNDGVGTSRKNRRERVFHFPMMAMLDEFEKLEPIVNDSLDILKNDEVLEYEIAIIIAFLQLYSKFPTPGSLVARLFKKNFKTYREVTMHCSETLINLMVPENAPSKEKFIASSIDDCYSDDDDTDDDCNSDTATIGSSPSTTGPVLQSYSFQHPQVARLVLKHSGRSVDQITQDFIQHKVLENYKKHDENRPLIDNLFLYNKERTGDHFSILVDELAKEDNGGRIFEEAAKQTKDVTFFSHVARFFAYMKGDFPTARDLIKEGFKVDSNAPVEKKRGVHNTEGYILLMEMKHRNTNIADIECLKKFSQEALNLFRKARGYLPWTFPNPLLGEVMVWHFCFEWIIRSNNGNVEEAIEFILKESFFSGAIGECIYLLDEVDRIVETVPTLNDPGHTKVLANERRRLLVQVIGRMKSKTKRRGWQAVRIHQICKEIVSKYKKIAPEKDIIRLRVLWVLNDVDRKIHLLDRANKEDLLSWLRRLVSDFKMFIHTRDLMEAAAEQIKPPFDIDEALKIVVRWQEHLPNDPFSFLYQCMLCFLKVCKGSVLEYRATYESALENCRKKSQGNPRRHQWQYFVGKAGDGGSICALLTRSKLETQYGSREKTPPESSGARRKEDVLDQMFWDNHCRDFLLECTGRIECRPGTLRGKRIPYIMMEPGNVKVSVPLNSIGTEYMDYQPDSRVSFVVFFTLHGPKAKGIRFIDSKEKKKPTQKQTGQAMKQNRLTVNSF